MGVRAGDICWADFEVVANSHVQNGPRPVYIIQCNEDFDGTEIVTVASITSKIHKFGLPVHFYLGDRLKEPSFVMFEQIHTILKSELGDKICSLSRTERDEADLRFLFSVGFGGTELDERKTYNLLKNDNIEIRKRLGLPEKRKTSHTA